MPNLPDYVWENERDARESGDPDFDPDGYDPDREDPYDRPDRPDCGGPGHPAEVPDSAWDEWAADSEAQDLAERGLLC